MSDYLGEIHLLTIVCYIWNLTFAALVPFKIYTNFIHFLNENPLNLQKMFNVLKQNSHCEIYDFSHAIYNYKLTQQFQFLFNNYTNFNKIVSMHRKTFHKISNFTPFSVCHGATTGIHFIIYRYMLWSKDQRMTASLLLLFCDSRINWWQHP